MAWLNGCIATELKDERKCYLFANGNDRSFPRTKAAVCCSTVTKLTFVLIKFVAIRFGIVALCPSAKPLTS